MIQVYDKALNLNLVESLFSFAECVPWKYGWKSNRSVGFAHWNYDICKAGTKNISNIENKFPTVIQPFWKMLKPLLPPDAYPIRCYANCHTFGVEGYPHMDSVRSNETTAVVYLNKEWFREWGGETVFYEGDEIIKGVVPKFGRLVTFPSNIVHVARAVSRVCPVNRITLVLKSRHPNDDDQLVRLEQFLFEIKANTKKHKHGSLLEHLIRTYDLLRSKNAPPEVCLAGGLHAAYGTSAFHDVCLRDHHLIENTFGKTVENLVHTFSTLQNRTQQIERSGSIELKLMEAANLTDQYLLKEGTPLEIFWKNYEGISHNTTPISGTTAV